MQHAPAYQSVAEHGEVLLAGIVGSTAYGLSRPGSDVDRLGIFATPTLELCGLNPPADTYSVSQPDDATFHEAAKYLKLALSCNPTVTELLWLDDYEIHTPLGERLIGLRTALLSARRVQDAYLGYATAQLLRLRKRGDGTFSSDTSNRTAKHARHMARLVNQGYELYTKGHLTIRVDDPDWYHEFSNETSTVWEDWFTHALERFTRATTVLPDLPHRSAAQDWLTDVRLAHLPNPH